MQSDTHLYFYARFRYLWAKSAIKTIQIKKESTTINLTTTATAAAPAQTTTTTANAII